MSALPIVTSPVTIDGTTQPGFADTVVGELGARTAGGDASGGTPSAAGAPPEGGAPATGGMPAAGAGGA